MSAKNDAAFLRMFLLILGALVAFTVIIMIAAKTITGIVEEAQGEDPRVLAAIADRIKPVGSVNVAAPVDAAPAAPKSGAELAAAACNSCHIAGVLNAPKLGDQAAWEQRLDAAGGIDGLTASAIAGKGGMPPKGGAMVSDGEIRAAIEHMLAESGVDAAAGAPAVAAVAGSTPPASPVAEVQAMAGDAMQAAESVVAAVMPAPVADVPAAAETAPAADVEKGKSVYGAACFVCHGTGAAGAPKLGDKAMWAPRIAQGIDALNHNSLNGKGAMPPKGGRMDLSDADVLAAVAYMVSEAE